MVSKRPVFFPHRPFWLTRPDPDGLLLKDVQRRTGLEPLDLLGHPSSPMPVHVPVILPYRLQSEKSATVRRAVRQMLARKLQVSIPEDHRLLVDLPKDLPAGPAEIIVLVAAQPTPESKPLSHEERQQRIRQVMGSGKGFLSGSDDFAAQKQADIDLEDRHLQP
jgi:hypothetical protein